MAKIKSIAVAACVVAAVCLSAFAEEQHTHTDAAGNTVTFEPIDNYDALTNLFAIGGSGYLTADITAERTLSVQADVDLCLNDKVLDLDGKGHITIASGKNFALYDCGTTVRYWEADANGLWIPADATDKTTTGGVITGGKNSKGGAFNTVGGAFTMYGGNICGNIASAYDSSYSGGVYIDGGTFTMNGGTICGNLAMVTKSTLNGGGGFGGGVHIDNKSTFTMKDGTICGNKATYGGGVLAFTTDSLMTIEGGTIRDNRADKAGGGVNIRAGECTIKNVTISGNRAETHGGGVYVTCESRTGSVVTYLTMENVKICDNVAALYGGGVYASGSGAKGSDVTVTDATISGNTAGAGGGIQVHAAAKLHLVGDADKTVSITGNTATTADGGIANWGEMHLFGKVVVKDNICAATDDDGRPVNLSTAKPLCIDGDLIGSEIHLTHARPVTNEVVTVGSVTNDFITAVHDTGVLTDGYPKYDADVFTYDGPFRMVEGEGGELVVVMTLSIFPNGDGGKFVPSARGTVTYEGAVIGADGVAGTVTLKMTKPNKKGLFNLTATVKTADKKSYTFKAKKVQAPAEGPLEMSLEGSNKKSKEHKLTVTLEGNSLRGAFDGAQIDGASDAFKDRKSKRAEAIKPFEGTWTGAFADGLVSFSAKLTKAGKAKVKVVLPGGKAASCSAKAEVGDLSDGIIAVPVTVRKSAKDGVTTFGFRLAFDMADGKLVCQVVDISPLTLTDKKTGAVTGSVRMDFSSASRLTMTSKAFKALPVNLPEALTAKLGQPTKVSLKMASTGIISGSLKFGKVGAKASGIVIGDKGIGQLTVKQGQTEEVFGFTVGSVK